MSKFERNEKGEYVCPACERKYGQYNSLFKHFDLKHGDGVRADFGGDVDKADRRLTEAVQEPLETVKPKELRRVRLTPVIPPVKKPVERVKLKPVAPAVKKSDKKPSKATENETEEEEDGNWFIDWVLGKTLTKDKQKSDQKDVKKKWLLIEGIL